MASSTPPQPDAYNWRFGKTRIVYRTDDDQFVIAENQCWLDGVFATEDEAWAALTGLAVLPADPPPPQHAVWKAAYDDYTGGDPLTVEQRSAFDAGFSQAARRLRAVLPADPLTAGQIKAKLEEMIDLRTGELGGNGPYAIGWRSFGIAAAQWLYDQGVRKAALPADLPPNVTPSNWQEYVTASAEDLDEALARVARLTAALRDVVDEWETGTGHLGPAIANAREALAGETTDTPRERCDASSYRSPTKAEPYGPGGYNRCSKAAGHGEQHVDEWGNHWRAVPAVPEKDAP